MASPAMRLAAMGAGGLLLWWLGRRILPLLGLAALSAAAAYCLLPLQKRLEGRLGRSAAACLCVLLPLILLGAAGIFLLPGLLRQAWQLLGELAPRIRRGMDTLQGYLTQAGLPLPEGLGTFLRPEAGGVGALLERLGAVLDSPLYVYVMLPVFAFYWLRDRGRIWDALLFLLPADRRSGLRGVMGAMHERLQLFLRGQCLCALAVGLCAFAGFALLGVPFAPLFALLTMVLDLIPTLGPLLAFVVVTLVTGALHPDRVLAAAGVSLVTQQLENLFIVPAVLGDSLDLHPMAVLLSILAGGLLAGAPGMLAALPLFLCLRELVRYALRQAAANTCQNAGYSVE